MSTSVDQGHKPQIVRKRSGEQVPPVLRRASSSRNWAVSAIRISSKNVQFDACLEHVRLFLRSEKPLAVSPGSSIVDKRVDPRDASREVQQTDIDDRPFSLESLKWNIVPINLPCRDFPQRKDMHVRFEEIRIPPGSNHLLGSVVVLNIAYEKTVVCRFTMDEWATVSEVRAEYMTNKTPCRSHIGKDRFLFMIELPNTISLEHKTLAFCFRYSVDGQEYWDNNNGHDFQVKFKKLQLATASEPSLIELRYATENQPRHRSARKACCQDQPPIVKQHSASSPNVQDDLPISVTRSCASIADSRPGWVEHLHREDDEAEKHPDQGKFSFARRYSFAASLSRVTRDKRQYIEGNRRRIPLDNGKGQVSDEPWLTSANSKRAKYGTSRTKIYSALYEEIVNKYCFFVSQPNGNFQAMPPGGAESIAHDVPAIPLGEVSPTADQFTTAYIGRNLTCEPICG